MTCRSRVPTAFLALSLLAASAAACLAEPAALLDEGDRLFRSRKPDAALELYRRAAAEAEAAGDRSVQVEALAQSARMHSMAGRLEDGREPLARAAELARPEEPLGWTRYLGVRGIFERESGDKAAALATFEQMHAFAVRTGLHDRAIDAAHHAAIVAPAEQQVEWAQRGIRAAEAAGSEGWLAVLWNNLGATYDWDLKDYPKAAECYEKARYFHHLGSDPQRKLAADWALGRALMRAGDLARAEELLPDAHEKAAARLAEEREHSRLEWAGNTAWALGELRWRQGGAARAGEALPLLEEAEKQLVEAGIESWWAEGLKELRELESEVRRAGSAG